MKEMNPILLFTVIFLMFRCGYAQRVTPKQYRNYTIMPSEIYQKHSLILRDSISELIRKKQEPYYQSENDSATGIYIDTILYSPRKNKIAFFVITENSNDKLLDKGNSNDFHFAAHCFIGHLDNNYSIADITWVRGYNLSNYKSFKDASSRIREIYFRELTERTNTRGKSSYEYNLDDVRIWDGPLWKKYYGE